MSENSRRFYIKNPKNTLKTSGGNIRNIQNLPSPTKTKQLKKSSETEYFITTPTQQQPSASLTQKSLPSFFSYIDNNNGNGNDNDNDGEKSAPRVSSNAKDIYNFSLVIGTITGLTLLVVIAAIIYRKKYYRRFRKTLAGLGKKNSKKNKNNNSDKNDDDYDLYYNYNYNNNNNNNNNKEGAHSASNNRGGLDSNNDIYYKYNSNNDNNKKEGAYSASNNRDGARLDNKKILSDTKNNNSSNKKKNKNDNDNNDNDNADANKRNNILQYQNFVKEDSAPQQKSQRVLHEIKQQQQQSPPNIIDYNRSEIKDVNNRINETTKAPPAAYVPNAHLYTHNYHDGESDSFNTYTPPPTARPFNNNTGQLRTKTSSTSLSSSHSNDNRKKNLLLDRIYSETTQQNNSSESVTLDINDGNNNNIIISNNADDYDGNDDGGDDNNYRRNNNEENEQAENNDNNDGVDANANNNHNNIVYNAYSTSPLSTDITPPKPQPLPISQNNRSPLSPPPLYSLTPTPTSMRSRNISISNSFETSTTTTTTTTSSSSDYSRSINRKGHSKLVSWLDGGNNTYDQDINNETAEINKGDPNTGDHRASYSSSSSSSSVYDDNASPKINNNYTYNVNVDGDGYPHSEDVRNKDGNNGGHSIVSIIDTNKTTQLGLVNQDEYTGYEEYYEEILEEGEEGEEEYYEEIMEEEEGRRGGGGGGGGGPEGFDESNIIGLPLELPEVPQVISKNLSINFERFSLFRSAPGYAENRYNINTGNVRSGGLRNNNVRSGLRNNNVRSSSLRNNNVRSSGLRNNNVRSSGVGDSGIRNNVNRNRYGNNYNTNNIHP